MIQKAKLLPTPKSSVALNSSVPASRLTSVAAVLKASSIPLTQNDLSIKHGHRKNSLNSMKVLKDAHINAGPYLDSWAYHKSWTL